MRKLFVAVVCALAAACTTTPASTDAASPVVATAGPSAGALIGKAAYICANGLRLQAIFQDNPSQVRLTTVENVVYILPQETSASGFVYSDGVTTFAGMGKDANFSAPGVGSTTCTDVTESK